MGYDRYTFVLIVEATFKALNADTITCETVLQIISQNQRWTCKHLPLRLRSAELNALGMTNTIFRDHEEQPIG